MTWVRIDDQFADHPKVVGLSHQAFRLHVTAICYAARQETDGVIPHRAAFVVASRRVIKELTDSGLWEDHPSGYVIHDFLDYNPSAATLKEKRARDSARKSGGIATDSKCPVPVPIPAKAAAAARDPGLGRAFMAVTNLGGTMGPTVQDEVTALYDAGVSPEWFELASAESQRQNVRRWSYMKSILERYQREGIKDRKTDDEFAEAQRRFEASR